MKGLVNSPAFLPVASSTANRNSKLRFIRCSFAFAEEVALAEASTRCDIDVPGDQ